MKLMLTLIAAAALSACATAQQPNMEPAPELKKFEWMLGTWTAKISWDMEGQKFETDTTMVNSWHGKFFKSDWTMDMMGAKMTETVFTGYDAASKKYKSITFTNFSSQPRFEDGEIKGDTFVSWTSQPWMVDGAPEATTARATFTKKSEKSAHFLLEFKQKDKWIKVGEATFTKTSGSGLIK
jgi:hypothetical protein